MLVKARDKAHRHRSNNLEAAISQSLSMSTRIYHVTAENPYPWRRALPSFGILHPAGFSCNTAAQSLDVIDPWGVSPSQDAEMPARATCMRVFSTHLFPAISATRIPFHISSANLLEHSLSLITIRFTMDIDDSAYRDISASIELIDA